MVEPIFPNSIFYFSQHSLSNLNKLKALSCSRIPFVFLNEKSVCVRARVCACLHACTSTLSNHYILCLQC